MKAKFFVPSVILISSLLSLVGSQAAHAIGKKLLPKGVYQIYGSRVVYYSDGRGSYCYFLSMRQYNALAGNFSIITLPPDANKRYSSRYEGSCTRGAADWKPHPDPANEITL